MYKPHVVALIYEPNACGLLLFLAPYGLARVGKMLLPANMEWILLLTLVNSISMSTTTTEEVDISSVITECFNINPRYPNPK